MIELELKSPRIKQAKFLTENEKKLIKTYVYLSLESEKFGEHWKRQESICIGIAQTLSLLDRNDLWDLINEELFYQKD